MTAYEIDPTLLSQLKDTRDICERRCQEQRVFSSFEILEEDFVLAGSRMLRDEVLSPLFPVSRFTHVILNPPYKKIRNKSQHRLALREAGIETSNLYTAFLAIAIKLLEPGGELVAITPRSFCNGPYFLPFRELLVREASLTRIHVFHSRQSAFREDDVLQENIIFHLVKGGDNADISVSSSSGRGFEDLSLRKVPCERVVNPADKNLILHIPTDEIDDYVLERAAALPHLLQDLGLEVSTGPVVDFRLREFIHDEPAQGTAPLIYPAHLDGNRISWPLANHRKPNAIDVQHASIKWLMPNGYYVLTRRFSSKEEKRRIVAALYDPATVESDLLGFENHLNVFHSNRRGLTVEIAKGLTAYLNSALVDLYFRQFSGHTQVNASDLRMLPYPSEEVLAELGRFIDESGHCLQEKIDEFLETKLMQRASISSPNPISITRKIEEAKNVLRYLRLPRPLQDGLSAHYLLALLNLKPESNWSQAPAFAVTHNEIMDFIREFYGRSYLLSAHIRNGGSRLRMFEEHSVVRLTRAKQTETSDSDSEYAQLLPRVVELARTHGSGSWEGCNP